MIALCVLALVWTQLFGSRGYICDCAGEVVITAADHCHGPEDTDCHVDFNATHQHDETDGSRQEHTPVQKDLSATPASNHSITISAPALLAILPVFEWTPKISSQDAPRQNVKISGGPPSVAVARTVVLLI